MNFVAETIDANDHAIVLSGLPDRCGVDHIAHYNGGNGLSPMGCSHHGRAQLLKVRLYMPRRYNIIF